MHLAAWDEDGFLSRHVGIDTIDLTSVSVNCTRGDQALVHGVQ